MGVHRAPPPAELPPHPDEIETQTHPADIRCDRAHVERAYWEVSSPESGRVLTLCRYHYRYYEIPLAMLGWSAQEINDSERVEQ